MDKLIVYVDDAAHALGVLQPLQVAAPGAVPRQWILVACAPRVTHHVSKWVTYSARESWRGKWAHKLFAQLVPALERHGDEVITCTGTNNLAAQTDSLLSVHGNARVIDARRAKMSAAQPAQTRSPGPGFLGAYLTLASTGMLLAAD